VCSSDLSTVTLTVTNNDPEPLTDIEIRYASTTFTQGSLEITTSQNFTITGLDTNTEFNFIATADADGKGFSEDSNTITQTTLAVLAPDILFEDSNQTRIRIKLKNNNAEECTIVRNFGTTCQTLTTSSTPITLGAGDTSDIITLGSDDLTPGTTYCIRAAAVINGILGPVEEDTITTPANQVPTVTFSSRTHNSLTYTFTNNNAVPAAIKAINNSGTGNPPNVTTGTATIFTLNPGVPTNHTFPGLDQNTNYRVGARAAIGSSLSDPQVNTAAVATIGYNISLSPTSVNEGSSTTASITTQNFGSGTLY
jgi:hypothetical protein